MSGGPFLSLEETIETAGARYAAPRTHRITLPARFLEDHADRGLPAGDKLRHTSRGIEISANRADLEEILSDATHYGDPIMIPDYGIGLVSSAQATRRRLEALLPAIPADVIDHDLAARVLAARDTREAAHAAHQAAVAADLEPLAALPSILLDRLDSPHLVRAGLEAAGWIVDKAPAGPGRLRVRGAALADSAAELALFRLADRLDAGR